MSNVYSIDIKLCATAYVKAGSAAEAMARVRQLSHRCLDVKGGDADVFISDLPMDHPKLPEISVSPAMTIHGVWSEFEEKEASMDLAWMGGETRR